MKNVLSLLSCVVVATSAHAKEPNENISVLLRGGLLDTSPSGSKPYHYGIGALTMNGSGNIGWAFSYDVSKQEERAFTTSTKLKSQSLLAGLSYGVTDHFYVVPKIGYMSYTRTDNPESGYNEEVEQLGYGYDLVFKANDFLSLGFGMFYFPLQTGSVPGYSYNSVHPQRNLQVGINF
ncbi:exported hypothetical protein [Vibrio chagasii]|nr:exported hypothetical protein [Vibrio chagasii]CAH7444973.1 exported hypothetical protein [Vibrio chagasii]